MTYKPYLPFNSEETDGEFDFKKLFSNKQWHKVPYHAKNIIINLGHLMNRNYFHKSYVTNKNEPRRLADIYQEQNNYFDYVIKHLTKFRNYEKDPGTKKAYTKLINMVSGKKKKYVKIKEKVKPKEKFSITNIKTKIGKDPVSFIILILFLIYIFQKQLFGKTII
jgi:hypothetical protein